MHPRAKEVAAADVPSASTWWLHDERERSVDRFVGQGVYACYLVAILLACAAVLLWNPTACSVVPTDVAASPVVPVAVLLAYRVASAALVLAVLVRRVSGSSVQEEETLDRRAVLVRTSGMWRLQGLTQCQFFMIGLYFAWASQLTSSAIAARRSGAAEDAEWLRVPSRAACAVSSVFGIALGLALMTTVIVTFVLVPGKIKNGTSAAHFFMLDELLMHNANSLMLVVDLLLGGLRVHASDIPLCVIFGTVYIGFHHYVRFRRTRTLLYFFLNWQWGGKAPVVIVALLSGVVAFFGVGLLISEVLREQWWGPPVAVLGNLAIMLLRHPPLPATQKQRAS